MTLTGERCHLVGTLLGLVLVVALVLHGRPAAEAGAAAWDVRMRAARTGELDVVPAGPFLQADDLRPERAVSGRVVVRNKTGRTLAVVAQATATTDLPASLRVRVRTGDTVVYEGPLAGATAGWRPWPLASGRSADVDIEVWAQPGSARESVSADVDWQFDVRAVEG